MATRFLGQPKIMTGEAPFATVRREPAAPNPRLGEKMGQLVTKGAVNLGRAVIAQERIQRNKRPAQIGSPGRAAQPGVPFHAHSHCQLRLA